MKAIERDLRGLAVGQLRRVRKGGFLGQVLRVKSIYESSALGTQVILEIKRGDEWMDFSRASATEVMDLTEASNQPLTDAEQKRIKAAMWESALAHVQSLAGDSAFKARFPGPDWAVTFVIEMFAGEITTALWPRAFPQE